MPTKEYYLQHRNLFIAFNYISEVQMLDVHYNLVFLYNQDGNLIRIL